MNNTFNHKFNDEKKQMTFDEFVMCANDQVDDFMKKMEDAES